MDGEVRYSDTWKFYKDDGNEWRWTRTAANHEIVGASTESYHHYLDCIDNARRNGFTDDQKYETE
jgi:uncharacterized protein YegP (UPF0339 family)